MRVRKLKQPDRSVFETRRFRGLTGTNLVVVSVLAVMVLWGFSSAVTVDIAPDTLNLASSGNYITAYIEPTVFKDDFSDASWTSDNWIVLDGTWGVQDGQYVGQGPQPYPADTRDISLAGVLMSPIVTPDFTMSVKVTNKVYGPISYWYQSACIPFRYVDNDHLVMLVFMMDSIGGDRIQLQISDSLHWHIIGTYPLANPYAQHEVVICAEGSSYEVTLDGVLAISATFVAGAGGDCPQGLVYLGGKLGLQAYGGATASFDDFVVTEIFDVSSVDVGTVKLWRSWTDGTGDHLELITIALNEPTSIGDYDSDGVPDVMVKFDRAILVQYLRDNGILSGEVDLLVTGGATDDGSDFSGGDSLRVISKGKLKL